MKTFEACSACGDVYERWELTERWHTLSKSYVKVCNRCEKEYKKALCTEEADMKQKRGDVITKDKNGVDTAIVVPVYYRIEKGDIVYDMKYMKEYFNEQVSMLPQVPHDRDDLDG